MHCSDPALTQHVRVVGGGQGLEPRGVRLGPRGVGDHHDTVVQQLFGLALE